jgi:hypothetical protein
MTRDKRVLWDADFYLSLSDETCLYCLSKRDVYVIAQALNPMMQWATRWVGDEVETLDLPAIAGELEYRLANNQCNQLQDIIFSIENLFDVLSELQQTVENGGVPPPNAITVNTPYYDYPNQNELVAGLSTPCDTTFDKDAIYGGVIEFVDYCVNSFTDFLQIVRATGSAIPEKVDQIISAIPIWETLPIDEVFGFAAYVFEEVEEAWDALLTEDRIQDFRCELFCAILANDCEFTPELIMMTIALKAPVTMGDVLAMGIRDAASIIVIGQPQGDEMFYSLIGTMLLTVLAGEQFLGNTGFRQFEYRFLAGFNSPDNDWSIFCTDCPEIYWNVDYRFFSGDDFDFVPVTGTFDSVFFNGLETDPDPDGLSIVSLHIEKTFDTPITGVIGIGAVYDAFRDCGITGTAIGFELDGVNVFNAGSSPGSIGDQVYRVDSVANESGELTIDKVYFIINMRRCDGNPAIARIHGIRLYLGQDTNMKDTMTYEAPYGTPPNGIINDDDLWHNWSVL